MASFAVELWHEVRGGSVGHGQGQLVRAVMVEKAGELVYPVEDLQPGGFIAGFCATKAVALNLEDNSGVVVSADGGVVGSEGRAEYEKGPLYMDPCVSFCVRIFGARAVAKAEFEADTIGYLGQPFQGVEGVCQANQFLRRCCGQGAEPAR